MLVDVLLYLNMYPKAVIDVFDSQTNCRVAFYLHNFYRFNGPSS